MTLQKKVYQQQTIGVIGELADTSSKCVTPYVLKANADVLPAIGRVFTASENDGELTVGGEGAFVGVAIGPKNFTCSTDLAPSLDLADGVVGEICSQGHIYITSETEVKPNYIAAFDPANGKISAFVNAEAASGKTVIANAKFILISAEAGQTAILELK